MMKRIVGIFLLLAVFLAGCSQQSQCKNIPPTSEPAGYVSIERLVENLPVYREEDLHALNAVLLGSNASLAGGAVPDEVFASGQIAYLLQQAVVGEPIYDSKGNWVGTAQPEQVWGQEIGKDPYPVLRGKKVYQVTNCDGSVGYSNSQIGSGHILGKDDGDCTTDVLCGRCGQVAQKGNASHDWREATCTASKTCTLCGTVQGQPLGHRYNQGACIVCGEAEPGDVAVPVITLKYPTLSFKDEVLLNVYFEAANLEDVVEAGLITYSAQVSSWNMNNAENVIPGYRYSEAKGLYVVTTNGIPAKNLGDTLWFSIYTKLSDGSYRYTKLVSYSPGQYAYSLLGSADAKLDRLLVSMLNYGTAAQLYFGHNTQELVNGGLTDRQKAIVSAYDTSMTPSAAAVSAWKQGNFAANGGFTSKYPSVSFKGVLSINYYCMPQTPPTGKMTLYYWNQADFIRNGVLTVQNATGNVTMNKTSGGEYLASVTGIPARQINSVVYVAICYSDGINSYTSGILPYSIGEYCSYYATMEHPFMAMAQATAVYGHYAQQYFG